MNGGNTTIVLLIAVVAVLIALHWVILPDPSVRNYEFLPNMVESSALDAQTAPTDLPAGVTVDLRPPEGAIARGYLPFRYAAGPEEALRAGRELANPVAADEPGAIDRGAFVFSTFCSVCHGAGGRGDGTVTSRGVPPPPSLLLPHAVEMTDGQMFHVITLGQGNMAGYASQVGRDDRWKVIHYIRGLQAAAEGS